MIWIWDVFEKTSTQNYWITFVRDLTQVAIESIDMHIRWNIFSHLGTKSTLGSRTKRMPGCFEMLTTPVVFPVEAFLKTKCPRQDFTPCEAMKGHPMLDWGSARGVYQ